MKTHSLEDNAISSVGVAMEEAIPSSYDRLREVHDFEPHSNVRHSSMNAGVQSRVVETLGRQVRLIAAGFAFCVFDMLPTKLGACTILLRLAGERSN